MSANNLGSTWRASVGLCFVAFWVGAQETGPRAAWDAGVRAHRMGTLVVEAPPGTEVRVEQVRHEFWFGAALANQMFVGRGGTADAERYRVLFLTNFNAAVTENALKWHVMEPQRGRVDYTVVEAMLAWAKEHRIPLRGHNIYWGVPNRVPDWQKSMEEGTLRETLRARALDVGRRYRGQFAEYDLNNEMLHANYYEDRLGRGITGEMARWVREADPEAVLYFNDYNILTGRRVDDYVAHIRGFLDEGVPFGGIGVQGHSHGDTFDAGVVQRSLDKLAALKLPIRITEFNFPGQHSKHYQQRGARLTEEEEGAKARAMVDYLRLCFAHPAVEGVLFWGFWEGANWIPVSSLYRRDWSPTPAGEAYRDLVYREWWTRASGKTDGQGRWEVKAFYGEHRVTVGAETRSVELRRKEGKRVVVAGGA